MIKKIKGDTIKWGILGVGDVCEVKSAPAMQLIEGSKLVAVMRRNGAKARDYAQRHQVPKWYDNADELINDPEVNTIYIATPPYAHEELCLKAAKAGKPIYVEKPMATSFAACQRMINACEEAKVPLYVAYYRRMLPNFLKLKALLEAGTIGDIRLVKIELYQSVDPAIVAKAATSKPGNWRIDPAISGGGYFFDLASHQFDYLDYIFGPIQSVNGHAGNQAGLYAAADIVSCSFVFKNGVQGIGSWCFTVDKQAVKDELVIIGSKGQISIPFFGAPEIKLEKSSQTAPEIFHFDLPQHIQQPLIQSVIDNLLGRGICPSLGTSAARTNWVLEEVTKAFYKK